MLPLIYKFYKPTYKYIGHMICTDKDESISLDKLDHIIILRGFHKNIHMYTHFYNFINIFCI